MQHERKSFLVVNKTMNLPLKEEGVCVGVDTKERFFFSLSLSLPFVTMALADLFLYFQFVQSFH